MIQLYLFYLIYYDYTNKYNIIYIKDEIHNLKKELFLRIILSDKFELSFFLTIIIKNKYYTRT